MADRVPGVAFVSPFDDRLVADPFNATGVWREFADHYRAAGESAFADLGEAWIAADDVQRGEFLERLRESWPVAAMMMARLLRIARPGLAAQVKKVVDDATAEYEPVHREARAKMAEALTAVEELNAVAAAHDLAKAQSAVGGVKVGLA